MIRTLRRFIRSKLAERGRRLVKIDEAIDDLFMPKRCLPNLRGSCECGHIIDMHADYSLRPKRGGACRGKRIHGGKRYCDCKKFTPKSYEQEQHKLRRKLREFAFRVLREV